MAAKKSKSVVSGRTFRVVESLRVPPASLVIVTDPNGIDGDLYDPAHRHDLPLQPAMLASVAEKGVVESITVTRRGDRLVVVNGRQRTRHAVAAGVKDVPVNVVEIDGHDTADMSLAIMELNRTAQGVADIDASRVAGEAIAAGKSRDHVARSMGLTESKLDALLALYKAPEVVKEAVAEGVISASAAAIIAAKPAEVAKAVIEQAVTDRAVINAADPGKAAKAPTGTATNLDIRSALAKAQGQALPATAVRSVTAETVTAPKGARTGGFNRTEQEALREALGSALTRNAADRESAAAIRGALAVLAAVMTGDPGSNADKCAALREAIASVRK